MGKLWRLLRSPYVLLVLVLVLVLVVILILIRHPVLVLLKP